MSEDTMGRSLGTVGSLG